MARLLWTLVLTGRMVDYAPLSGLGLSVRAVDTAECTINSPLLFYYSTNLYTAKSLQKLRLLQEEYRAFVRVLRETF